MPQGVAAIIFKRRVRTLKRCEDNMSPKFEKVKHADEVSRLGMILQRSESDTMPLYEMGTIVGRSGSEVVQRS
jgi:hypothetical protein